MSTPKKKATCNTKTSKSRAWCFTLNNYTKDDIKILMSHKADYVFQEETGEKGTPHLQGYILFANAISFNSIKDKIPRAHIEPAKNKIASIRYCSKVESRTGKIFTNMDISKYQHKDTGTLSDDRDFLKWLKNCEEEDSKDKLNEELKNLDLHLDGNKVYPTSQNYLENMYSNIWIPEDFVK